MSDRSIRIGDTERDQAAAALGEHFAQGRLSLDEHAERLDQIWAARTRGDLEPVFRDLPGRPARLARTPRPSGWVTPSRRRGLPFPVVPVLVLLGVLTVVTHVPLILLGLLIAFFVVARRRRWHARP
jgi:hypothetical protein